MEETTEEKKKYSDLVAITSSAVEIDEDTFYMALRLGGRLMQPNQFKEYSDGKNYIHILEYKGRTYMTRTRDTIAYQ